ncbi:hypothetical protein [Pseudodesulfovibrio sediminis]|uniref:DUF3574 domain-containing protein n=1 Tax=Pseudodesulfovibrio sediminis TaxID=2810563 RepID=A0ABM7P1X6_9BACT|nr:hypothetical protein [Pseudodesulfovibrio sediminis]BCS86790.1 hypothetical protein PSDVSF_00320 [Pseudodesulfovibrio sediminis]
MKRLIPFMVLFVFSLFATGAFSAEPVPSYIHFVVVDSVLPDGSDSRDAVLAFEKEVIKLAGGFTEIGATRGGALEGDAVVPQKNISFMISADRDISRELKTLTTQLFGGRGGFILAWQGTMLY